MDPKQFFNPKMVLILTVTLGIFIFLFAYLDAFYNINLIPLIAIIPITYFAYAIHKIWNSNVEDSMDALLFSLPWWVVSGILYYFTHNSIVSYILVFMGTLGTLLIRHRLRMTSSADELIEEALLEDKKNGQ